MVLKLHMISIQVYILKWYTFKYVSLSKQILWKYDAWKCMRNAHIVSFTHFIYKHIIVEGFHDEMIGGGGKGD